MAEPTEQEVQGRLRRLKALIVSSIDQVSALVGQGCAHRWLESERFPSPDEAYLRDQIRQCEKCGKRQINREDKVTDCWTGWVTPLSDFDLKEFSDEQSP